MTKLNVSFKKDKQETGLAAVGNPYPCTDIKLNKLSIGMISPPNWQTKDNLWRIRLTIKFKDNFNWITFKIKFKTEPEARLFIKKNINQIVETYDLYQQEPY